MINGEEYFSISWYNYFNKLRKEVINMIFGNLKYADKYDFFDRKKLKLVLLMQKNMI